MSRTVDDGGTAFPLPAGHIKGVPEGMTLRDWFAGQALNGLMAARRDVRRTLCAEAYEIADWMILEKKK